MNSSSANYRVNTILSLSLLFTVSSAFVSNSETFFNPEQKILQPSRDSSLISTPVHSTKYTYDLGLGKNRPVIKSNQDHRQQGEAPRYLSITNAQNDKSADVYQASQFLDLWEHQSIQEFPSPLQRDEQPRHIHSLQPGGNAADQHKIAPQRQQRSVEFKRHLEDVLFIYTENGNFELNQSDASKQSLPIIVHPGAQQLDVNSVWVEMMLHHQLFS